MNVHQATAKDGHYKPWGAHRRSPVVMVLQNERLYVDFLEEMLAALGFSVGGTFCRCSDTEEWLKSESPDAAVIDAEVQDGRCRDVAALLLRGEFRLSSTRPCPSSSLCPTVRSRAAFF